MAKVEQPIMHSCCSHRDVFPIKAKTHTFHDSKSREAHCVRTSLKSSALPMPIDSRMINGTVEFHHHATGTIEFKTFNETTIIGAGLGAANTDDQWGHRISSSCNRDRRIKNLQLTSRTFPPCLMFNELEHAIDPFATKFTHHWIRHRQEVHGHSINWSRNFLSRA